eukprot:RCo039715
MDAPCAITGVELEDVLGGDLALAMEEEGAAVEVEPVVLNVPDLFQPREGSVPVIDPKMKAFGRVWLPQSWIYPSSGLARFRMGHPYPPSLCLLFQSDRCQAGLMCNQIHASRSHVSAIRAFLRSSKCTNCCLRHGDLPSARSDFRTLCHKLKVMVVSENNTLCVSFPSNMVAMTAFWAPMLEALETNPGAPLPTVLVTPSLICNLHQHSSCRFGLDCKHVHLCRERFAQLSPKLNRANAVNPTRMPNACPVVSPVVAVSPMPQLSPVPRVPLAATPTVLPIVVAPGPAPAPILSPTPALPRQPTALNAKAQPFTPISQRRPAPLEPLAEAAAADNASSVASTPVAAATAHGPPTLAPPVPITLEALLEQIPRPRRVPSAVVLDQ